MSRCLLAVIVVVGAVFAVAFANVGPVVRAEGGGSISGVVYFDTNLNGRLDQGEPPAGGRTVELLSDSGLSDIDLTTVATSESASDGSYRFDDLDPAANYGVSLIRGANTPCIDNGVSFYIGGQHATTADLGVAPGGDRKVSGTLLSDLNENGERDAGEPPLAGWQLRLTGGSEYQCQIDVTSDDQGNFEFGGLPGGQYRISPIAAPSSSQPHVWELTFPTEPFNLPGALPYMRDPSASVDLESSDVVGMEMGLHMLSGTGSLAAWTYSDVNGNGALDAGEASDCCQVLFLRSTEAGLLFLLPQEQTAIGVGHYELTGLPEGDYTVTLATWMPNPIGNVAPDGRPIRTETLNEGESSTVYFGFALQPLPTPVFVSPSEGPRGLTQAGEGSDADGLLAPTVLLAAFAISLIGAGLYLERLRKPQG
jgi:hypothetical protein